MPKTRARAFILFCCSVVILAVTYKLVSFWMGTPQGPMRTVFYEVKQGEPPQHVARDLAKLGIVSNERLFFWYARFTGKTPKFKAGDYKFTTKMKPDEVLAIIMSGISFGCPLTVPEGYSARQIAELVEAIRPGSGEKFYKLCNDKGFISQVGFTAPLPPSLEGYLFPDTYMMQRNTSEEEVIRNMVKRFRDVYTPELQARAKAMKMSERQVITLASMIEKETGAKSERPMISSVFHNRLKKRMRLQSDPTVIYGMGDSYDGNIHKRDLETYTPYNTYRVYGLPPGPIANPGKESIHAALYPEESKYLYFVSHNDGTHEFTSTYEEHTRAVTKFQLDRKARQGKSWRQLHEHEHEQSASAPVSR